MASPSPANLLQGGNLVDSVSMAADITGKWLDCRGASAAVFQFYSASGTRVGDWKLQGSLDGTNVVTLAFLNAETGAVGTVVSAANGSAQNDMIQIDPMGMPYIRPIFTSSSGTGTGLVIATKVMEK